MTGRHINEVSGEFSWRPIGATTPLEFKKNIILGILFHMIYGWRSG